MNPIIEVEELYRTFGDQQAVDGITFAIEPGEVFGLLGPNDASKMTTARLLNGIPPPSAGNARVFGLDSAIQGKSIQKKRRTHRNSALYEHYQPAKI